MANLSVMQAIRCTGPAELIVKVKRIWTGDPNVRWAEAVAVAGRRDHRVGSRARTSCDFAGRSTRVIERPDAFAMPGLIDAHGHMESLGASEEEIDLRGVASLEEVAQRVVKRIELPRPGRFVDHRPKLGPEPLAGGAISDRAVLDAVSPQRPVWLERVDGHAGWANSEAMRRAKVTKDSKAPSDGQIIRDSDGQPTGVFIDGAMSLVGRAVPSPTLADVKRRLLAAQKTVLAERADRRPRRGNLCDRLPTPIANSIARGSSWFESTAWRRPRQGARSRS